MRRWTPYADAGAMPAASDGPLPANNRAPVPDEMTLVNLQVEGTLPVALTGRCVRIGSNPDAESMAIPKGLAGMVHAVELHAGRAVRYWSVGSPAPRLPAAGLDGVATNIMTFAGKTLVLGPGDLAHELDNELSALGRVDLAGHGRGIGAHPQVDPLTGALHLVSFGDEPAHHIVAPNIQTRITTPFPDAPGPLRDILLTREKLVLLGEGFVGVADRSGRSAPRWVADADLSGAAAAHDGSGVADADDLGRSLAVLTADRRLVRWTLDSAGARFDVLDDTPQRFGITNPGLISAPAYLWTVATSGGTAVHRHDLRTGDRTTHDLGPGRHPGELSFVPDPSRSLREDGGWLIGFVHDHIRNEAALVVLDAAALDHPPIATVRIPRPIPDGLQGTWIPGT
jgi:8'-apo-carotenoid 13,14-cleaving dioxygenase